jgi:hypothetical protein
MVEKNASRSNVQKYLLQTTLKAFNVVPISGNYWLLTFKATALDEPLTTYITHHPQTTMSDAAGAVDAYPMSFPIH